MRVTPRPPGRPIQRGSGSSPSGLLLPDEFVLDLKEPQLPFHRNEGELPGVRQHEAISAKEPSGPGLVDAVRDLDLANDPAEVPVVTRERLRVAGESELREILPDRFQPLTVELEPGVNEKRPPELRDPIAVLDVFVAIHD